MNRYFKEAPKLKGERITLRNINPDIDNPSFYKMFLEPEMHLWTGNDIPSNELETYELLCKYRDLDGLISWSIIKNDTQEFIGTYWIAPYKLEKKRIITAEAQRIGKQYWRRGYTKEARKLIYNFAFFELDIEEINAVAWKNNINSCKSMESAGFHLYKSEKKLFEKHNKELIENHYILTKDNWNMMSM
ncbi:GNAT family N-acetyltransferase [Mesobacillus maritimus]|uniref:GNAT family N-acetyltransferase n=1 Tax=Mesobacillus maritimus TaxID=1643336 RepID=UPI002040087F|nr:GNAT family N-acetyltransferase [Mesobacillus maritimus]MCM3671645.1 GNAT family N-acetyltransferase [Mesobacillus maritimus]